MVSLASPCTIVSDSHAADWMGAVRAAGDLLVQAGAAKKCYVEAMLRTAQELGPYYVIANGIAVPHARPEEGALRSGLCVLRLAHPVVFGSIEHDPVSLVVAFCSPDPVAHVLLFAQIARKIASPGFIDRVKPARTADLLELFDLSES